MGWSDDLCTAAGWRPLNVDCMRGVVHPAIGLVFGIFASIGAVNAAQPAALIFAVHPYLPPQEIMSRFSPLAHELAHAIGRPVTVHVGRSYAEHIDAVGADGVDIAYMGPASYVKMTERYGMKPLLRSTGCQRRSVFAW